MISDLHHICRKFHCPFCRCQAYRREQVFKPKNCGAGRGTCLSDTLKIPVL